MFGLVKMYGQSGTLIVSANGFESEEGNVVLTIFRKDDNIPAKPFLRFKETIHKDQANFEITNLEFGDYAIILFHDQNKNDILDHRLGFPDEPMGFSNNWQLSLFSGMPNFRKLKFNFSSAQTKQHIIISN